MNNYNQYEPYKEEYSQTGKEPMFDSNLEEVTLYTDGDDKKPKLIIIGIGIVLLLIVLVIILFACSKQTGSKVSTYLKTVSISNATITPSFDKNVFEYEVESDKDSVIIRCNAEDNKSTVSGCNRQLYISNVCQKHTIKVIAPNNKFQEYNFNVCKKNSEAPTIKAILITPNDYTNESVKVTVEATSNIELHKEAYSFDDGATWQTSNEFIVHENKSLKIKVRNKNEIETSTTHNINNIDKIKPTVKIEGSVKSGVETTSNVELTAEVIPATVISGYKYQWYKGNSKISNATKSSYLATTSGDYKVVVTTGSGNVVTSDVYKVVKKTYNPPSTPTKPTPSEEKYTLAITSVTGNPTEWTSNNVTLTVKVNSSNGLHSQPYSFDGGKTYQTGNSKTFTSNQEVNIIVRDKKNKTTSYKVKITKIDKTKPVINIIGEKYTNSELTVSVTPASSISGYKYQWYKDNTIINGATQKVYTPTVAGVYKVKVTTGAGILQEYTNIVVSNKVKPTVGMTANADPGKWTSSDITMKAFTINGTATKYEWYKDNKEYKDCTSEVCKLTTTQDATYKVRAVTSSGKTIFSATFNAKIDKTVPTSPTIVLSSTSETTEDVTFKITSGTDGDSGVKNTQYSYDKKTWTSYKSGDTITLLKTTGVKTVYARTIDNVDNVSKIVSATGKCDKDKIKVGKQTDGCNDKGCWFKLNFSLVNTGLTGITTNKYEYVYWNATKTSDTSNKQSSQVTEKCGTQPPSGATIRTTTDGITVALYRKYSKYYYCFAIRPYRKTEISGLNRWTVQWKHAYSTGTIKADSYNGD